MLLPRVHLQVFQILNSKQSNSGLSCLTFVKVICTGQYPLSVTSNIKSQKKNLFLYTFCVQQFGRKVESNKPNMNLVISVISPSYLTHLL